MKTFKMYMETMESEITLGKSLVRDNGVKFQLPGGYIDIQYKNLLYAPRSQSIVDFVVDSELRGQGIGTKLINYAISKFPDLGGQASSIASIKVLYNAGFRNPGIPNGSFQDHEKKRQEDSSVFMAYRDEKGNKYIG
jgi:GNAT superfamily N-acetyltransferase